MKTLQDKLVQFMHELMLISTREGQLKAIEDRLRRVFQDQDSELGLELFELLKAFFQLDTLRKEQAWTALKEQRRLLTDLLLSIYPLGTIRMPDHPQPTAALLSVRKSMLKFIAWNWDPESFDEPRNRMLFTFLWDTLYSKSGGVLLSEEHDMAEAIIRERLGHITKPVVINYWIQYVVNSSNRMKRDILMLLGIAWVRHGGYVLLPEMLASSTLSDFLLACFLGQKHSSQIATIEQEFLLAWDAQDEARAFALLELFKKAMKIDSRKDSMGVSGQSVLRSDFCHALMRLYQTESVRKHGDPEKPALLELRESMLTLILSSWIPKLVYMKDVSNEGLLTFPVTLLEIEAAAEAEPEPDRTPLLGIEIEMIERVIRKRLKRPDCTPDVMQEWIKVTQDQSARLAAFLQEAMGTE